MAVLINQVDSTVETAQPAAQAAQPPQAGGGEMSDEDFRARYGSLLRVIIRDELERYLRTAGD